MPRTTARRFTSITRSGTDVRGLERTSAADAGVVDQDVASFERLGYAIAELGEILELRDVAADRQAEPPAEAIRSASASSRSSRRAAITTQLRPARNGAPRSPKPDDAPVTTTTEPRSSTQSSPRASARPSYDGVDGRYRNARRPPPGGLDDRWTPRMYAREELVEGLLARAVAGLEVSHPLDNVLRNIRLLHEGDRTSSSG